MIADDRMIVLAQKKGDAETVRDKSISAPPFFDAARDYEAA